MTPATAGLSLHLGAAWDVRGASPGVTARLAAVARGHGGEVLVEARRVRLSCGPEPLTRAGVGAVLGRLESCRSEIEAALPTGVVTPAEFELVVAGTGVGVDASVLRHLGERLAAALLLLLGRHGFDRVCAQACGDGVAYHLDRLPSGAELAVAVPVVAAFSARLLADARQGIAAPLLRHPSLCGAQADGLRLLVPAEQVEDILGAGRGSAVAAVSPAGIGCRVSAQRSLEALWLHAGAELEAVTGAGGGECLAAHLRGERPLPPDLPPTRPAARTGTRPQPRTLVIVEPWAPPRPGGLRFAALLSAAAGVEVLVAPWFNLRLLGGDRGVVVGRSAARARDGGLEPLVLDGWRPVDALYAHLTGGTGPAGASDPERAALAHLAAGGVDAARLERHVLIDRLLCRAAGAVTRTSGVGWDGAFAVKASLERIAAAWQAATGRVLPRPRTLVGPGSQVPAMIDRFHRAGLACVVKVSNGTRAEGTTVVAPGEAWAGPGDPGTPADTLVVQELLPRPLLLGGGKADLRCHLLIDVDAPGRCGRIGPVLVRRSAVPWRRGRAEAEIVNRSRPGPAPELHPLESTPGLDPAARAGLLAGVDAVLADLVDLHRWWASAGPGSARERRPGRVQHWGVDLFAGTDPDGRLELRLLEVNVHPQLFRDLDDCDAAVERMLLTEYLPALLEPAPAAPTPATVAAGTVPGPAAEVPARPGIAVLHPGDTARPGDRLIAAALSRAAGAPVHLCRWTALTAGAGGLGIAGDTGVVVNGSLRPAGAEPPPVRLDILWGDTLCLGNTPALSMDGDAGALRRLVAAGLADTAEKSLFAHTEQLLLGAARRGVLTNACGGHAAWGDKARLEDILRACSRAGGPRVARPRTHPVHGSQAALAVAALHAAGRDCVVKPAVGSWGEGISIHLRDRPSDPPAHTGEVVVQQLITDPLLAGGHKLDLRCHLVVDAGRPSASRRLGPIVGRRAAAAYVRGEPIAEITNVSFQQARGVATALTPIDGLPGLAAPLRAAVEVAALGLVDDLLAAHAWWAGGGGAGADLVPAEAGRILVWALDILVSLEGGRPRALLAEVNVRPQLVNDGVACFDDVESMLDTELAPAVVAAARRSA